MKTPIIILLLFSSTLIFSQSLFEEKLLYKMEKASKYYKSGDKDKALNLWLKVEKKANKSSSIYGKVLRSLLYFYSQGAQEHNLLATYSKILQFELNDTEKRLDVGRSFTNFKYHSTIQLASYYKKKGFFEKALSYIEKADNSIVYQTNSISNFANKKIDLAIWKYWIYKELKEDNKALNTLIKRAFEYNYKAQYHNWYLDSHQTNDTLLLNLILENYEDPSLLKKELDSSISNSKISKANNKIIELSFKGDKIMINTYQEIDSFGEKMTYLKEAFIVKELGL